MALDADPLCTLIGPPQCLDPDPYDFLDPRNWVAPSPEDAYHICLSDRWDIHAIVDYQDWLWARELKWCHTYGSGEMVEVAEGIFCIARPEHIYARNCAGGTTTYLHREICERAYGKPRYKRAVGDHKNGKTLDCRRANLRWATPSMNSRNTPSSKVRAKFLKQMGAR